MASHHQPHDQNLAEGIKEVEKILRRRRLACVALLLSEEEATAFVRLQAPWSAIHEERGEGGARMGIRIKGSVEEDGLLGFDRKLSNAAFTIDHVIDFASKTLLDFAKLKQEASAAGLIFADEIEENPTVLTPTPPGAVPTNDKLAVALRAIGAGEMAAKAQCGYYHDYISPLSAPAVQLVQDLRKLDTDPAEALAQQVIAGAFDATKEEGEAWANSQEARDAFGKLMRERK